MLVIGSIFNVDAKNHSYPKLKFLEIESRTAKTAGEFKQVVKDENGYFWIGTWGKLLRYDGYNFQEFKKGDFGTANTLVDEVVNSLDYSKDTGLLIGGVYALTHYNDEKFSPIVRTDKRAQKYLNNNKLIENYGGLPAEPISGIFIENNETVWIGTRESIVKYNPIEKTFERYSPWSTIESPGKEGLQLSVVGARKIKKIGSTIWLGTVLRGLIKFDSETKSAKVFEGSVNQDITLSKVTGIVELDDQNLLLTSSIGLIRFNHDTEKFARFPEHSPITEPLTSIRESNDGTIWVGGLNLYQIHRNGSFTKYDHAIDFNIEEKDTSIGTIFIDEQDTIFAFYNGRGIFRASPYASKIRMINDFEGTDNNVKILEKEAENRFWAGFANGLVRGEFIGNKLVYETLTKSNKESFSGVRDIHIGLQEKVLVAEKDSITIFNRDLSSQTFKISKEIIKDKYIHSLIEDSDGVIWFSVRRNGIFKLDPKTGLVEKEDALESQKLSLWKHISLFTSVDRKQVIYLKSSDGFGVFDIDKGKLVSVFKERERTAPYEKELPFRESSVWNSIKTNTPNKLWVTHSEKYISFFDLDKAEGGTIDTSSNEPIFGITSSQSPSDFWFSGEYGSISKWYSDSNLLEAYDVFDGLPENGVNGTATVLENGNALFGSREGIAVISTASNQKNSHPADTKLTSVLINNKNFASLDEQELALEHFQHELEFGFFGTSSALPNKVKYQYRLLGNLDEWRELDQGIRKVKYNNLDPGSYIFQIRSSNNDQVWQESSTNFRFVILPPWYLTWQAITSALVIFLLAFFVTYKVARRISAHNERILKEKVNEQTSKIQQDAILISEQNQKLLANNARIKELVISIAHELRTPLSVINGINTKISNFTSAEPVSNLVSQSNRNISGISRKIDLLLLRAKIENNAEIPHIEVNLSEKTKSLAEQFKVVADVNGYFFEIDVDPNIGVTGDPHSFEQLIANLVSNAIKYNSHRGSISISLKRVGDKAYLVITDTGRGISPEGINKITKKWSQESNSSLNSSGLGMSLVKEIVDHYDGELQIESELGSGTRITVTLPCFKTETSEELFGFTSKALVARELSHTENHLNNEMTANAVYTLRDETIDSDYVLLVEDNAELASQLLEELRKKYTVHVAKNGLDALEIIDKHLPSIIVSDILMPEMDGFELVKAVKHDARLSFIPFILLTANADEDIKLRGLELGANDFLAKPINTQELLIRLKNTFTQIEAYQKQLGSLPVYGREKIDLPKISPSQLAVANEYKQKIVDFMEDCFPNDPKVQDAADLFGMHVDRFRQSFKKVLGIPPSKYIKKYKIEKAKRLLITTEKEIVEICFDCGFNSTTHLSREFKEAYGHPPKKYRDMHIAGKMT